MSHLYGAHPRPFHFEQADALILGTSTWGMGNLQDDWQKKTALAEYDTEKLHVA